MRKLFPFLTLLTGVVVGLLIYKSFLSFDPNANSISFWQNPSKPLEKYSIEKLASTNILPGKISVKSVINEDEKHTSYLFEFDFNPNLDGKTLKKVTGMLNIPTADDGEILGTIVMIRGFVDQDLYETGMGTKNVANYFSDSGYITIAPDFLGYADSDEEAEDIFEARFQTYVTVISLINTLRQMTVNQNNLALPNSSDIRLSDNLPLFIWGHSNGGQIALSVLEITGWSYPTVLWAPVTKPFPYSILYYTDDADDGGKFLRRKLADFEKLYDTDNYSLANYTDRINAPLLINQGTADESVPQIWSDSFVETLKDQEKEVDYQLYPGANHNLQPLWSEAVKNSLEFYNSYAAKNEN